MSRAIRLLPLAAIAAASLAACGGSDSPASPAATTSGVVTGSYYENAKVCIDANNNAVCDSGEVSAMSDKNGAFTLNGSGNVVAEVGIDATRHSADGDSKVARKLVFRAPSGSKVVLSAISTELMALMDANGGKLDDAGKQLAERIGVDVSKLLADHNTETDAKIKAILQAEIDQTIDIIADAVAKGGKINEALRDGVTRHVAMNNVKNIVVIYAENRGFDNLYGLFPNADGIPGVNPTSKLAAAEPQKDFDGSTLSVLPPTWSGVLAAGQVDSNNNPLQIAQASTTAWPNKPFQIDAANGMQDSGVVVDQSLITRDLVHRFYNNQMQINGGKNDKFTAYSDAGGLSMGYYDGSKMAMWQLAKEFTLADNFYIGAFGGSFLNHQYLVCACAPEYPEALTSPASGSISAIDKDVNGNFTRLTPAANASTSVLTAAPTYLNDSTLTAVDDQGKYYAVNTMQPAFQPSGNAPATWDKTGKLADPTKANTLPAQTATTIANLLDNRGISWAWYSGAWNAVSADRTLINNGAHAPNFQTHHQPFNFYAAFDPLTHADYRTAHLKDFDASFLADAKAGTLPAVTFYKPQGNLNQHAGYASVKEGDDHIASVIAALRQSPQWKNMVVVVTYDENGGFYDHAAVPKGDRWGPGTRIPAMVISPFSKKNFIDHTQYDTGSVLRLITHRFNLPTLPGLKLRDDSLVANGKPKMGDLSAALDFTAAAQ